jgi:hypothetical protein
MRIFYKQYGLNYFNLVYRRGIAYAQNNEMGV